jgi:PEGA domain
VHAVSIRRLVLALLFSALGVLAFASEQAQVVTWPSAGTPILQFTFGKFREISSLEGRRTFVTDTIAQNLSGKLIPTQKFSIYIFDTKQVRIGEAWMQVDNLAPGQTTKFQISFDASGTPAAVTVLSSTDVPRTVSLTVNSVPQGAALKVDGVDAGATPKMISVGVGKHQLTFSKEGFNAGTFPLEIGPEDVSGGTVSYELGASRYDTIVLRDGSVLNGDLDSVSGMDVVVRIGGTLQHFSRNQIKQIIMVEREPPSPDSLPEPEPKP